MKHGEAIADSDPHDVNYDEATRLLDGLARELEPSANASYPPREIKLDNIYARTGVIAGPVVTDSYHFGQTWVNDFGRPFGRSLSRRRVPWRFSTH